MSAKPEPEKEFVKVIWEVIFDKSLMGKWHRRKLRNKMGGTIDKEGHLMINFGWSETNLVASRTRYLKSYPHVYKVLTTITKREGS